MLEVSTHGDVAVAQSIIATMLFWISEGNPTIGTVRYRLLDSAMEEHHNGRGLYAIFEKKIILNWN